MPVRLGKSGPCRHLVIGAFLAFFLPDDTVEFVNGLEVLIAIFPSSSVGVRKRRIEKIRTVAIGDRRFSILGFGSSTPVPAHPRGLDAVGKKASQVG